MAARTTKKTYIFETDQGCISFHCDLSSPYRILKQNKQRIGSLIFISQQSGQVFKGQLTAVPHLNLTQQWNQDYFVRLLEGFEKFFIQEKQYVGIQSIQTQSELQALQDNGNSRQARVLLVRDLKQKQQIYLLRCRLQQQPVPVKKRQGTNRLWQQFQVHLKFRNREQQNNQKNIQQLEEKRKLKVKQLDEAITAEQKKKNILRKKLTQIFLSKKGKLLELNKFKTAQIENMIDGFGRFSDESSSIAVSQIQLLNSQQDRPLTGSLFDPSQDYFYKQSSSKNGIDNQSNRQIQKQDSNIEMHSEPRYNLQYSQQQDYKVQKDQISHQPIILE